MEKVKEIHSFNVWSIIWLLEQQPLMAKLNKRSVLGHMAVQFQEKKKKTHFRISLWDSAGYDSKGTDVIRHYVVMPA